MKLKFDFEKKRSIPYWKISFEASQKLAISTKMFAHYRLISLNISRKLANKCFK